MTDAPLINTKSARRYRLQRQTQTEDARARLVACVGQRRTFTATKIDGDDFNVLILGRKVACASITAWVRHGLLKLTSQRENPFRRRYQRITRHATKR